MSSPFSLSSTIYPYQQWRIQDFPRGGGAPTPKSAIIFQFFCRKLHENERIWTPLAPPPWILQCVMRYIAHLGRSHYIRQYNKVTCIHLCKAREFNFSTIGGVAMSRNECVHSILKSQNSRLGEGTANPNPHLKSIKSQHVLWFHFKRPTPLHELKSRSCVLHIVIVTHTIFITSNGCSSVCKCQYVSVSVLS